MICYFLIVLYYCINKNYKLIFFHIGLVIFVILLGSFFHLDFNPYKGTEYLIIYNSNDEYIKDICRVINLYDVEYPLVHFSSYIGYLDDNQRSIEEANPYIKSIELLDKNDN